MNNGTSFVITGTLKSGTRDHVKSLIENAGGSVKSSLTRSTDFLVVGADPGDHKLKQADRLSVPHITENELLKLLKENDKTIVAKDIWKSVGNHFEADVNVIKKFKVEGKLHANFNGEYLIPHPDNNGLLSPSSFVYEGIITIHKFYCFFSCFGTFDDTY